MENQLTLEDLCIIFRKYNLCFLEIDIISEEIKRYKKTLKEVRKRNLLGDKDYILDLKASLKKIKKIDFEINNILNPPKNIFKSFFQKIKKINLFGFSSLNEKFIHPQKYFSFVKEDIDNFFEKDRISKLSKFTDNERRIKEKEFIEDMLLSLQKIKLKLKEKGVIHSMEKLLKEFNLSNKQYQTLTHDIFMDMIFKNIEFRNSVLDDIKIVRRLS